MIKTFNIKGFKLFKELTLTDLNLITILGGKNNSGKTSVLEALFMFYDRGNPEVLINQFSQRNVNSFALNSDLWAPIFNCYDLNSDIEMSVENENDNERVIIKHNSKFSRQITIPILNSGQPIKTDQKLYSGYSLDFRYFLNDDEVGSANLFIDGMNLGINVEKPLPISKIINFISSCVSRNPNDDANKFGQLDVKGETADIVKILKIIEPRLKSLTSVPQGNISLIHGDIGLSRKIPVQYMGEGTSKLLSIILAIASNKNGIVLIDEIENGFHYSIMSKIWDALYQTAEKFNCQIFATTHSYEALKALYAGINDENKNAFSYIRLDNIDNTIIPKIYSSETFEAAIANDWEVR